MIKKLIESDDYMLHNKVKSCSYNLDRHELSKTLIENMIYYNGVGLLSQPDWYTGKEHLYDD